MLAVWLALLAALILSPHNSVGTHNVLSMPRPRAGFEGTPGISNMLPADPSTGSVPAEIQLGLAFGGCPLTHPDGRVTTSQLEPPVAAFRPGATVAVLYNIGNLGTIDDRVPVPVTGATSREAPGVRVDLRYGTLGLFVPLAMPVIGLAAGNHTLTDDAGLGVGERGDHTITVEIPAEARESDTATLRWIWESSSFDGGLGGYYLGCANIAVSTNPASIMMQPPPAPAPDDCRFGTADGGQFVEGEVYSDMLIVGQCCGLQDFATLELAKERCNEFSDLCGGVTQNFGPDGVADTIDDTFTTRDNWFSATDYAAIFESGQPDSTGGPDAGDPTDVQYPGISVLQQGMPFTISQTLQDASQRITKMYTCDFVNSANQPIGTLGAAPEQRCVGGAWFDALEASVELMTTSKLQSVANQRSWVSSCVPVEGMARTGMTPRDLDGDGVPNSADPDDDNDGYSDKDEAACNSNPRSARSVPADADNDGLCDDVDPDDDNDGTDDSNDVYEGPMHMGTFVTLLIHSLVMVGGLLFCMYSTGDGSAAIYDAFANTSVPHTEAGHSRHTPKRQTPAAAGTRDAASNGGDTRARTSSNNAKVTSNCCATGKQPALPKPPPPHRPPLPPPPLAPPPHAPHARVGA
eukprot:SAG22_NODE_1080_length_5668_cov_3.442808_1_plen_635_part_00